MQFAISTEMQFAKGIKMDAINQPILKKLLELEKCEFRTVLILLLFDISSSTVVRNHLIII